MVKTDGRLQKEKDFHNQTFQEHGRQAVDKYYVIARRSHEFYTHFLQARCNGRRVLEYGCGPGSYAFMLARHGASVVGIDISDVAISQARQKAQEERLAVDFRVMDAEQLTFPDGAFDLVCGTGILHHLTLDRSYSEIARVLDSAGVGIFIEALGHNPLINLYRRLTPQLRTEDEHPLLMPDLALAKQFFPRVETRFYYLFSLLAVPFRKLSFFPQLLAGLDACDGLMFRLFPFLRRYAWMAVIVVYGAPKAIKSVTG